MNGVSLLCAHVRRGQRVNHAPVGRRLQAIAPISMVVVVRFIAAKA